MTALKRARLATGMSKRQAAEYLDVNIYWYRKFEYKHWPQDSHFARFTMKLWNKCYHDRYRYGGTYAKPW